MACMRCGRDTQEGQVFCENCLEVMEWYPVKPGTAVQLPTHRNDPPRKAAKRRVLAPEDQIKKLRRVNRLLTIALVLALLVIGLLAVPVYEHLMNEHFATGQNYSTVINTQPQETAVN